MMFRIENEPTTRRRRRWLPALVLVLVALGCLGFFAKGRGWKTRLVQPFIPGYGLSHPAVRMTRPSDKEINVLPDAFVAADVVLPNHSRAIDGRTLTSQSVQLY